MKIEKKKKKKRDALFSILYPYWWFKQTTKQSHSLHPVCITWDNKDPCQTYHLSNVREVKGSNRLNLLNMRTLIRALWVNVLATLHLSNAWIVYLTFKSSSADFDMMTILADIWTCGFVFPSNQIALRQRWNVCLQKP